MDRTNWKFSNTNINILTLGIIYEVMAFPIVFNMMDKRGNSNTEERMELIRDLRLGTIDVLVGINLLREGLDLPEVSLIAILDADKEGFLRSETSLIQTIGRAARNANGQVIMYADVVTNSMERAISETYRRRAIQIAYNEEHGIVPQTIVKDLPEVVSIKKAVEETKKDKTKKAMTKEEKMALIMELEEEMRSYAKALNFEMAAQVRDAIMELKSRK